jgi:predicted lipoprotein with Yx(FWY)xxD motif
MHVIRTLALLVVAFAFAGSALAASGPPQAVVKLRTTSLGKVLVAANGKTLYMFAKDGPSQSLCNGACEKFWPPYLTSGTPKAGPGVKKASLGVFERADRGAQVTYKAHPLYFFAKDTKAGQTGGEGLAAFGAKWWAVSAAGTKVTKPAGGGGGGYHY